MRDEWDKRLTKPAVVAVIAQAIIFHFSHTGFWDVFLGLGAGVITIYALLPESIRQQTADRNGFLALVGLSVGTYAGAIFLSAICVYLVAVFVYRF